MESLEHKLKTNANKLEGTTKRHDFKTDGYREASNKANSEPLLTF